MTPGHQTWYIGTTEDEAALVGQGWCATDRRVLEENYQHISWALQVDGKQVDLDSLAFYDGDMENRVCRGYTGIVQKWPVGRHVFVQTLTIDETMHDGWDTYPAGEYVDEFVITVW